MLIVTKYCKKWKATAASRNYCAQTTGLRKMFDLWLKLYQTSFINFVVIVVLQGL